MSEQSFRLRGQQPWLGFSAFMIPGAEVEPGAQVLIGYRDGEMKGRPKTLELPYHEVRGQEGLTQVRRTQPEGKLKDAATWLSGVKRSLFC